MSTSHAQRTKNHTLLRRLIPLAFALDASVAHAEPSRQERANASFIQARAAFARREFTVAALGFEQAGEYEPHPVAWLNASEAWVIAGDMVRAAIDCDRVLETPALAASYRQEAENRLKSIEDRVATLDIKEPLASYASIDAAERFPLPARKRVIPGAHVVVFYDGSTALEKVDVKASAGQIVGVAAPPSVDLLPPVVAPKTDVRRRPTPPLFPPQPGSNGIGPAPTATWFAFGASGIASAATVIFGLRTLAVQDDFDRSPTAENRDDFFRERLITNVSLGLAVAAAAVGLGIWVFSPEKKRPGTSLAPLPNRSNR
jgi:hypothetical protein